MPAFYTQRSGFKTDYRLDTAKEIAAAIYAKKQLKLDGGMLIVNPIPNEYSMSEDYINANIEQALADADKLGITGKQITPFLLDKIQRLTDGKSLAANIQLVYNNVRLACGIATELCKIRAEER